MDPSPQASSNAPVSLLETEADIARILLRYRLYTYQPDEMITMMALSAMRPGELDLDPQLYQYGGLFLYPAGALIKLCGVLGLIDVRSDVTFYLDQPDEFGKFYVVARLYAAAWGLLGVFIVFGIAQRLGGTPSALVAAALFALLPVVVCMSHEGKPHLPGAVLMLSAVWFAMRHVAGATKRYRDQQAKQGESADSGSDTDRFVRLGGELDWWMMCVCCGAALGMVLSSLPIFVLIPLVSWMETAPPCPSTPSNRGHATVLSLLWRTLLGVATATAIYLVTNPYIVINAFANRDVLRSNFGNSLAMYEVARVGEGLLRVLELTVAGATLPVLALGTLALVFGWLRRNSAILPLVVPAGVFFLQFVLIGAGKPGEYGRFGIFPDAALAIGAACLFGRVWIPRRAWINGSAAGLLLVTVALSSHPYLTGFRADAQGRGTRAALATTATQWQAACERSGACSAKQPLEIVILADPAPYSLPPLPFSRVRLLKVPSLEGARAYVEAQPRHRALVVPADRPADARDPAHRARRATIISWANKPFLVIPPQLPDPVDAAHEPP